jgi:hypothetical protein
MNVLHMYEQIQAYCGLTVTCGCGLPVFAYPTVRPQRVTTVTRSHTAIFHVYTVG